MISRRALVRVVVSLALIFSSITAVGSASELSDAQSRYTELQVAYQSNLDALNGWLPKSEADSQACIDRLSRATSSADISSRQACQDALIRFQAYKEIVKKEIEDLKVELASLESLIQSLKSSGATGTSPITGGISASPSGSALPSANSPTPSLSPTPQVSPSSPAIVPNQSTNNPSPTATPAATESPNVATPQANPLPTQNSTPASTTQSPKPVASNSPSIAQKVTPSLKPIVKKKTITCVKGKTVRKVIAVKPLCPKGFKVQKSK